MRLITGPRRQTQGPRTSGNPTACGGLPPGQGAYGPSGHQQWHFARDRQLRPGPALPRNDPPVEWPAGRYCRHPAPVPHASAR